MSQSKPKFSVGLSRILLLSILILVVAACRPRAAAVLPTPIPTQTTVPRSTPLPPLPTAVPIGQSDNPFRLIIHAPAEPSEDTVADIEAAIEDKTDLVVKIELVTSDAEALTALCASTFDKPALAWLSGIAYVAANAKKCGQPQLLVSRGTGSNAVTGEAAAIVARRGIDSLTAVDGRIVCRVGPTDLISWLIPSMMMRAAGLNPISDPKTIKDYAAPVDLVKAVSNSACDITAILESSVQELVTDDTAVDAKVSTISTSIEFPYAVLTASSDIPLTAINKINAELVALSKDRQMKSKLKELLGQDALVSVTAEDLQPLLDFAVSTGQDFAQLGN